MKRFFKYIWSTSRTVSGGEAPVQAKNYLTPSFMYRP